MVITLECIISKANKIIETAKKVEFFTNKCSIVASTLKDNIDFMQNLSLKEEEKQEELSKLEKTLLNISSIIEQIENKSIFWSYIFGKESFQKIISDINARMKEACIELKNIGIETPSELPTDTNFDDFSKIEDFLHDTQILIKHRRKEVQEYLKQSQYIHSFDSIDKENIDVLQHIPTKKVNKSDFIPEKNIYDSNSTFDYYRGTDNRPDTEEKDKKVTILKLRNNYKHIFKRLISVLMQIDHKYVESFIGAYIENNEVTIITNRNGIPLSHYFTQHSNKSDFSFNPGDRTILAFKIAQAMSYLHSRRIIHRNLDSSNIFIQHDDSPNHEIYPMIVGFRESRFQKDGSSYSYTTKNVQRNENSSFFAPEHLDNHTYDEKVDVFSYSGILYELLTDSAPFVTNSDTDTENLIKKGERPELKLTQNKEVDQLINLIELCWSDTADQRPSFDSIIDMMCDKNIIFPQDEDAKERILQFYNEQKIQRDSIKECIDKINLIKQKIGQVFQYRLEFLRTRPILHNYQHILRESKYSKKEILEEEEEAKIDQLSNDLDDLYITVDNSLKDKWIEQFKTMNIDQITNEISKYMNNIYKSMKVICNLVNIPQYKEISNDLVFDYLELASFFKDVIYRYEHFSEKVKDIRAYHSKLKETENYIKEKNLDGETLKLAFKDRIKDLFSPFQSFEVKSEDYIIDEKINRATSKVYKGRSIKTQMVVAIKKIEEDYLQKGENQLIFLRREIGYLTKLNHKYIAEFIGYALPDDSNEIWLISKYYSDGTLHDKLHVTDDLSPLDKTKIAYKIAQAMEYLHSKQVLHLDLKPGNVLMDGKKPILIDFGYSSPNNDALKIKSDKIGTQFYTAPEIINNENYCSKADVYSYGMLLWEIYYGELPNEQYKDENNDMKFDKEINDKLKILIQNCYNKDQSKRWPFTTILNSMINNKTNFGGDFNVIRGFYNKKKYKENNNNNNYEKHKRSKF